MFHSCTTSENIIGRVLTGSMWRYNFMGWVRVKSPTAVQRDTFPEEGRAISSPWLFSFQIPDRHSSTGSTTPGLMFTGLRSICRNGTWKIEEEHRRLLNIFMCPHYSLRDPTTLHSLCFISSELYRSNNHSFATQFATTPFKWSFHSFYIYWILKISPHLDSTELMVLGLSAVPITHCQYLLIS